MIDLSNREVIKKLDPKNTFDSTGFIPDQCLQVWNDGKKVDLPKNYKNVKNIVIAGMGGSAYAGYVIQALYKDKLKVPFVINNDYLLPEFVNKETLVVITSYSGNTEENLANLEDAKRKKAKILGLTSGGKLAEAFKKNKLPCFVFDPKLNYARQPRLGVGYLIFGTFILLKRLNVLSITETEVKNAVAEMKNGTEKVQKTARLLAPQLYEKSLLIFTAEFLTGNGPNLRNLFNETAKNFAVNFSFPDLNHHLMEGLQNPSKQKLCAFFITSDLYSAILKKRIKVTQEVLKKNKMNFVEYKAEGSTKLAQVLNILSVGAYTSLYLGLLYGLDPSQTPWVDYFKERLAQ